MGINQGRSISYESDTEMKNLSSGSLHDKMRENDKAGGQEYSDDEDERVDIGDESPILRKTPLSTSADKSEGN